MREDFYQSQYGGEGRTGLALAAATGEENNTSCSGCGRNHVHHHQAHPPVESDGQATMDGPTGRAGSDTAFL